MKLYLLQLLVFLSPLFVQSQSSDNPYDEQGEEHEGMRYVKYKGKYGYINEKGTEVIPIQYTAAYSFENGIAEVSLGKGRSGFIDKKGKVVIPLKYDSFIFGFENGYSPAQLQGKWGIITDEGKTVVPHLYNDISYFQDGLALASRSDGNGEFYGFVNEKGKEVIPFQYDMAGSFSQSLASVKKNGKWGFITRDNKLVVPFTYESVSSFSEGLAAVKLRGLWGYINAKNELVIKNQFTSAYSFSNGEGEVEKNGKGYKIDKEGNLLPPGQYLLVFTKGLDMGKQFWNLSDTIEGNKLYEKYKQGYRLNDYVYNQHKKELFVTMSDKHPYTQMGISYNNTMQNLWKKMETQFKDGYNTTHITFGNGKWSWNATKFPRQQGELRIAEADFPLDKVKQGWLDRKYITTMAQGENQWIVIMRNEKYSDQMVKEYSYDRWNVKDVEEKMKKGYAITEIVKEKGTYTVVFTKGTGIKDQLLVWADEIPVREIKSYWDKGYGLYRTFYLPRWITIDKSLLGF